MTIMDRESLAFTSDQVLRIAGITRRQLGYWVDTGLVAPDIQVGRGRGRVRLFSFSNMLEIRIAAWLRGMVSLQLIRRIVARLRERGFERPLSEVRFGVVGDPVADVATYDVVMQMPDGRWEDARRDSQLVMELTIPLQLLAESIDKQVSRERRRLEKVGRIERRRGVLGSTPVVAGTRVPTRALYEMRRAGFSDEDILRNYPGLQPADIEAAVAEEQRRRVAGAG